ncbi:hypothetical protein [Schleiferilactobacillus harbinensis]|mgnify:CR=1 FL=1|uniref:Uncharacterized protein n=1 Tax=Schleiferilactobacillus harbinensis TaxID=304207 RepID=A0ABU7T0W6_9LACO
MIRNVYGALIFIAALLAVVANTWLVFALLRKIPISKHMQMLAAVSTLLLLVLSGLGDLLHW